MFTKIPCRIAEVIFTYYFPNAGSSQFLGVLFVILAHTEATHSHYQTYTQLTKIAIKKTINLLVY